MFSTVYLYSPDELIPKAASRYNGHACWLYIASFGTRMCLHPIYTMDSQKILSETGVHFYYISCNDFTRRTNWQGVSHIDLCIHKQTSIFLLGLRFAVEQDWVKADICEEHFLGNDKANLIFSLHSAHETLYLSWYTHQVSLNRDITKPTKWVCAQRRFRSAWTSAQSDQSLRCPHEESWGP